MNVVVKLFYLGTRYHGSQIQPGLKTIERELQKAVDKYNETHLGRVKFSGRTDKGVHSLGQIVVLPINDTTFYPEKLNTNLPEDIIAWAWTEITSKFNPRRQVKSRTYKYILPIKNRNYDINKIIEASKILIGEHNFTYFSKPSNEQNPKTAIYDIEVIDKENYLEFIVKGRNFLWMMVRKIVTALMLVGYDQIDIQDIKDLLLMRKKPSRGFQPAPANGLILWDIETDLKFKINPKGINRIKKLMNDYLFNLQQSIKIMEEINDYFKIIN